MKHISGHFYLDCVRCRYDWNVTEERTLTPGPYICPTCRKILRAQEKRMKRDDEQKQD